MLMLYFDMRRAPFSPSDTGVHYRNAIEMAAWADDVGLDIVRISEHHATEDCYNPSPIAMVGAMASRTKRITLEMSALLLNLHHPIRAAEDLAVLDRLSNGRVRAVIGLGYRQSEYEIFGADWSDRGKLMDKNLDVLLRALKGETVVHNGVPVRISPLPTSDPHEFLSVGGSSIPAAKRAARFRLQFTPAPPDLEKTIGAYLEEAKRLGFENPRVGGPSRDPDENRRRRANAVTFIAEDPEKEWVLLEPYFAFEEQSYGAWGNQSMVSSGAIRASGRYQVITPDEAIEVYRESGRMRLTPLAGGLPAELGWRTLNLFKDKVMPHLGR